MGDGCPRKGEEAEGVILRDGTELGTGGEERLERGGGRNGRVNMGKA
jgi:hypothetical protein